MNTEASLVAHHRYANQLFFASFCLLGVCSMLFWLISKYTNSNCPLFVARHARFLQIFLAGCALVAFYCSAVFVHRMVPLWSPFTVYAAHHVHALAPNGTVYPSLVCTDGCANGLLTSITCSGVFGKEMNCNSEGPRKLLADVEIDCVTSLAFDVVFPKSCRIFYNASGPLSPSDQVRRREQLTRFAKLGAVLSIAASFLAWSIMNSLSRVKKIRAVTDDLADKCPVYFDDFCVGEELQVLPCNHKGHFKCMQEWFSKQETCPLCRRLVHGALDQKVSAWEHAGILSVQIVSMSTLAASVTPDGIGIRNLAFYFLVQHFVDSEFESTRRRWRRVIGVCCVFALGFVFRAFDFPRYTIVMFCTLFVCRLLFRLISVFAKWKYLTGRRIPGEKSVQKRPSNTPRTWWICSIWLSGLLCAILASLMFDTFLNRQFNL